MSVIRIVRFEITAVEEVAGRENMEFFPKRDELAFQGAVRLLDPWAYDPQTGTFPISVHSWLVRSPEATILIDTSFGNYKQRSSGPGHMLQTSWLERLTAAGVEPDDVDYVLLTHLHSDHVGWNTQLIDGEWCPTFTNAVHVMTKVERDARDPELGGRGRPWELSQPFLDIVKPVLERGRYQLVDGDESGPVAGVNFLQTPGHSPGQMAVRIRDGGLEALFVADVVHLPIQIYLPTMSSKWCEDRVRAAETRIAILNYAADAHCLILHPFWWNASRPCRAGGSGLSLRSHRGSLEYLSSKSLLDWLIAQ